ncbi:hypothetical protein ACP70R_023390 [Stipagrostis hirtigluma subsp. patula]
MFENSSDKLILHRVRGDEANLTRVRKLTPKQAQVFMNKESLEIYMNIYTRTQPDGYPLNMPRHGKIT